MGDSMEYQAETGSWHIRHQAYRQTDLLFQEKWKSNF